MKKILSTLAIVACLFTQAQTVRFGTSAGRDNTYRTLTLALITTTDVTAATIDTITFTPNAFHTIWRPSANLADSCVIKFSSTITTYSIGDTFEIFLAKGTGDGRVRMGGSKYAISFTNSTGIAIEANKTAYIRFQWNGTKWVETARVVTI